MLENRKKKVKHDNKTLQLLFMVKYNRNLIQWKEIVRKYWGLLKNDPYPRDEIGQNYYIW